MQPIDGEILPPEKRPVLVQPYPFSARTEYRFEPEGVTLADIVRHTGLWYRGGITIRAWIEDEEIPQANWHLVRPKAGKQVSVRAYPHGGGTGGKSSLQLVLMAVLVVIVIAASIFIPGFAAFAGIVLMVGMLAIRALAPPPKPKRDGDTVYSIQGTNNRINPYGPIPRIFGKRQVAPLIVGRPWTETVGDDQYVRMLLLVGYGPLRITEIKLGTTPIDNFEDVEYEVTEGGAPGWAGNDTITLYNKAIVQQDLSVQLEGPPNDDTTSFPDEPSPSPTWHTRQTSTQTIEISVDITFPSGLSHTSGDGKLEERAVYVQVQYRVAGSVGAWLDAPWQPTEASGFGTNGVIYTSDETRQTVRRSGRWLVSEGQYEVRVRRWTDSVVGNANDNDASYWTALRSYRNEVATRQTHVTLIALRIKATAQLNGVPDQVNCIAESYLPVWNGVAWSYEITRNPAWAFAHVLRWRNGEEMIADDRIDVEGLKDWADACDAGEPGSITKTNSTFTSVSASSVTGKFTFAAGNPVTEGMAVGGYIRFTTLSEAKNNDKAFHITAIGGTSNREVTVEPAPTTMSADSSFTVVIGTPYWQFDAQLEGGSVFSALQVIASHARANVTMRDGLWSVVRDVAQTVPVQHITPRNSYGYSGNKLFVDLPHAIRARFINPSVEWQQDETIVPDDGYTEETATKFEVLDFLGCTSQKQAYREARYHMAVARLRPEEHTVFMDIEHLKCSLGDYVFFAHDVISVGQASGRVKGLTVNGSSEITHVLLDGTVAMDAVKTYGLRARKQDGDTVLMPVVTSAGTSATVQLTTPIAVALGPEVGDLVMFGETALESMPCIVRRIEPGPNLTAKLSLVPAQAGVWTADTSTIPAFATYITQAPTPAVVRPPAPTFSVRSDETALVRAPDGTLMDCMLVHVDLPVASAVQVGGFEVHWKSNTETSWKSAGTHTTERPNFEIREVFAGELYDVRARLITQYGIASEWTVLEDHEVIGKTTPPADVTGLDIVASPLGFRLTWNPNTEVDLAGYEIRFENESDGLIVLHDADSPFEGTSLEVLVYNPFVHTFTVRAVDVIGITSAGEASVAAQVTEPADLTDFRVYPQDMGFLRFSWTKVGEGYDYEIREGDTWEAGNIVIRSSGDSATVMRPTTATVDRTFWIKAVSPASLSSAIALAVVVAHVPTPNRNVVLQTNIKSGGWTGTQHDVVESGGNLVLGQTAGVNARRGDYFHKFDLGANGTSRAWIEATLAVTANAALTWDDADFAWDDAGLLSWEGDIIEGTGASLSAKIMLRNMDVVDADIIECFRLDSTTTGLNGTVAAVSTGVSFADCYFYQGARIDNNDKLEWNVTIPSDFTVSFDLRLATLPANDYTILQLWHTTGPRTLSVLWINSSNTVRLTDGTNHQDFTVVRFLDDVVTFVIVQDGGTRRFALYSRHYDVANFREDSIAAAGGYSKIRLNQDAGSPINAAAVFGDVTVWTPAWTHDDFTEWWTNRRPPNYQLPIEFLPGDYTTRASIVQLHIEPGGATDLVTVTSALVTWDVPDIIDSDTDAVGSGGSTLNFARTFNIVPDVSVVWTGGATKAFPEVTAVTTTGFTVRLWNVASPASGVAGNVAWVARGY